MCLMTYFYRLAWAFIAELKSYVLTNLIFYLRYYLSFIKFDLERTKGLMGCRSCTNYYVWISYRFLYEQIPPLDKA